LSPSLATADWIVIGLYLVFSLAVGLVVRERAASDRESYFLAGRSLTWWWAGASIAATTFAADTPLAVTGIVASRGLSGNWIWLSWIGVHAAVVVYFAVRWNRSGVVTDAELIGLRYSGRAAAWLRSIRALLFGVVYNAIILGWVLRGMVKIATPFFRWEEWTPWLVASMAAVWPAGTPLGAPADGLTILLLLGVVAFYSSLGGLRGVVFTDLFQLGIAMIGSIWLAAAAWQRVGGTGELETQLARLYGDHQYLDLMPTSDWMSAAGIGAFTFGVYLIVQSYANVPADGGGYLMQRLSAARSPREAKHASLLFLLIQYVLRSFPWFVVAVSALVLIPIGGESAALGGAAAAVAADRELAYPVLMGALLPPIVLGLMITGMLAAFMSTVDTHLNWGASYVVNDLFLALSPHASTRAQLRLARIAVLSFVLLAVIVSFHIETIEQAWKWVAALGAALGLPTALRWIWWRVNAAGELTAMLFGLGTALLLGVATDLPYELRLIASSGASAIGLLLGIALGPRNARSTIDGFAERVRPFGFWPARKPSETVRELARVVLAWCALVLGTISLLFALQRLVFLGDVTAAAALAGAGAVLVAASLRLGEDDA
jgi:Na+/proline symporter